MSNTFFFVSLIGTLIIYLCDSNKLVVVHFGFHLDAEKYLGLFLQNLIGYASSVGRQILIVILAPEINKHLELLLLSHYLRGQLVSFVEAVDVHLTFLDRLNSHLLCHQIETGTVQLFHQIVAQLVVDGCNDSFVTVRFDLCHLDQQPDGSIQVKRWIIPGSYVLQQAVKNAVIVRRTSLYAGERGRLEEVWLDRIQVLVELRVHHVQSEVTIISEPLQCHILQYINDCLIDRCIQSRTLHLVLLIEVENLQQVAEMIMLFIHNRVL